MGQEVHMREVIRAIVFIRRMVDADVCFGKDVLTLAITAWYCDISGAWLRSFAPTNTLNESFASARKGLQSVATSLRRSIKSLMPANEEQPTSAESASPS